MSALFLVLWTWPFAITLIAFCILVVIALETRHEEVSTVLVLGYLTGLYYYGSVDYVAATISHPFVALGYLCGYLTIGAVWSLFKWYLYVDNWRDKFIKTKVEFLTIHEVKNAHAETSIPESSQEDWARFKSNSCIGAKPNHTDRDARIKAWIGFWPWSVLGFLLNNPIQWLVKQISKQLSKIYAAITEHGMRGLDKDL